MIETALQYIDTANVQDRQSLSALVQISKSAQQLAGRYLLNVGRILYCLHNLLREALRQWASRPAQALCRARLCGI